MDLPVMTVAQAKRVLQHVERQRGERITQSELAAAIGLSLRSVNRMLNADPTTPIEGPVALLFWTWHRWPNTVPSTLRAPRL